MSVFLARKNEILGSGAEEAVHRQETGIGAAPAVRAIGLTPTFSRPSRSKNGADRLNESFFGAATTLFHAVKLLQLFRLLRPPRFVIAGRPVPAATFQDMPGRAVSGGCSGQVRQMRLFPGIYRRRLLGRRFGDNMVQPAMP